MRFGKLVPGNRDKRIIFLLFVALLLLNITVPGQDSRNERPLPSEEQFEPTDGVVNTYLETTNRRFIETQDEKDTIRIYNADGTLWYEFSLYPSSPLFFRKNPKSDFKPYQLRIGYLFDIRVKAISNNWYEVVANEETQVSKYIPIDDPITGYQSLEHYVKSYGYITYDREKNPLRESPNGKIRNVETYSNKCFPEQIKGEWLYLSSSKDFFAPPTCSGWIRWKKDRDILIGFILNEHKIPGQ